MASVHRAGHNQRKINRHTIWSFQPRTYGVQWFVGHPLLVLVWLHGEAQALELRVLGYKGTERLGMYVFLSLHLYRGDDVAMLHYKVYLHTRVVAAEVIYGQTERHELGENEQLSKCALVLPEQRVGYEYALGRGIHHSPHEANVEDKQLENGHV